MCASKVIQEVNFPKSFLSLCIQDGLWLCTYIAVFLDGVRWRHNRAPNLEPRYLVNFVSVSGRIATPIMVINDIVINTLLGRVTRHPAGMHCPARDDAFVSSRTYSRRALCDLHQTLHGDRARRAHPKRCHSFWDPTHSFSYRVHGKIGPN